MGRYGPGFGARAGARLSLSARISGDGVTAPVITSINPSGDYIEGGLIEGRLTADRPVTWLVSGADASQVTLDPDSGIWSLGPTDHAAHSSYALTFEAIDAAGNRSSQGVTISITPAQSDRPVIMAVTASVSGPSEALLKLTTDKADGALFWVVTQDESSPDAAAIKAGTGFVQSGSQAVSVAGEQTISVASLMASTRYTAHILHTDANGEESNVVRTASFITHAADTQADAIIMFVAGQSNSRKANTTNAGLPPDNRYAQNDVFMWIAATNTVAPYEAKNNTGHQGAQPEWGTEAEVIYQMRQAGETRPVFVVKESVNGNDLADNWHPDTRGSRFDDLENQVASLRAWLGSNTGHETFAEYAFWNQGEADANDDGLAASYQANMSAFMQAFRSRISSSALFISERIRPLGYAPGDGLHVAAGFARAYQVREGGMAAVLADGNAAVIDTDFETANFTNIHPHEPTTWNSGSWTTQIGLRAYAAITGTYDDTYGVITDNVPDAFSVPASSGEAGATITSNAVAITGIERRAAIFLSQGLEMRILNLDGSLHTSWTNTPGFIDKFQTFIVRAVAPVQGTSDVHTVTIGGVSADWTLDGAAAITFRSDTQAWLDRLASEGGASLSPTQAAALDTFYQAAADSGWMDKVRTMVLPLGSEVGAMIDLKSPANLYVQGGLTNIAWDAAGQYWRATDNIQSLVSNIDPSVETSQNGIGVGAWLKALGDSTAFLMGSDDGTVGFRVRTSGSVRAKLHNASNINFNGLTIDTPGFFMINRHGGSDSRAYGPAGEQIASSGIASETPTATVLRLGVSGTTDKESGVGGIWLTDGMTASDIQLMRDAMTTLMAEF